MCYVCTQISFPAGQGITARQCAQFSCTTWGRVEGGILLNGQCNLYNADTLGCPDFPELAQYFILVCW